MLLVSVATGVSLIAFQVSEPETPPHEAIPEGEPFPSHIAPGVLLPQPAGRGELGPFVSVQVNTTFDNLDIIGDAANEPSIAVDPTDPSNIAIGWRQFDTIASSFRQAGYSYSRDAGLTWAGKGVHTPGTFRSDPVLRAGPEGELYYLSLRNDPALFCEVFVSPDFGEMWAEPVFANGGDKAWMAIDHSDRPTRGAIYQHYSSDFTRSFDEGLTWSRPTGSPPTWGQIAISPDGRVFIAGRGDTNTVVAEVVGAPDPETVPDVVDVGDTGIFRSLISHPINPVGLLGQANIAFDRSGGEFHGRMYVLQSTNEVRPDDIADTVLVYSDDDGVSFSEPIRINDDPPGRYQWFGTLSVAPNGRVDAVWNDQRDSPDDDELLMTRLYASYSTDGGETWAPNFPVSPLFDRSVGYPVQQKLGDYYDAHSDNLGMDVAYAATFNGGQDVYFLRIGETDCNADGVPDQMQTAAGLAADCDGDGMVDSCQARLGAPPACYCPGDLAPPFGVLDFADVIAFLSAFGAGAADADLAEPFGVHDFGDVIALLTSFGASCP